MVHDEVIISLYYDILYYNYIGTKLELNGVIRKDNCWTRIK